MKLWDLRSNQVQWWINGIDVVGDSIDIVGDVIIVGNHRIKKAI